MDLYLDAEIRRLMVAELDADIQEKRVYESTRLRPGAMGDYVGLLRQALLGGDTGGFADAILQGGILAEFEARNNQGKVSQVRVRKDAHELLAEGQFNYYYMRSVCLLAISRDTRVVVFRAKGAARPRPESEQLIGKAFEPAVLLQDLRQSEGGVETVLGLPPGAGSGLSIRLVS